ncbi:hypothetical protein Tco_1176202 [Tanacetum coccineum]
MEQLYLLKEKHFVVVGRGQSCHNLTPFIVGERGLEVTLATESIDITVTSATKDVKICFEYSKQVAIASAQKNKGSLEAESIVRAASTRVRFRLSTTPFCSGVRGVEV